MTQEQTHIKNVLPDTKPEGWGYTIIARVKAIEAEMLLEKLREVWSVAASWGRFMDEELGDWPAFDDCLRQLPDWFGRLMQNDLNAAENWTDLLHDRDWAWWSSYHSGDIIKIDVQIESLPTSFWPLKFVIETLGGEIIYEGNWINREEFKKYSDS